MILIAEAKGAAATAGSAAASLHVADMSRRLGVLEERTRRDAPRLASDGERAPPAD